MACATRRAILSFAAGMLATAQAPDALVPSALLAAHITGSTTASVTTRATFSLAGMMAPTAQ